jgi:hypothetical protein
VTLRARWVTLRARWVTLRARWVTLRARWVTLRARWVTLRARWVTQAVLRVSEAASRLTVKALNEQLPMEPMLSPKYLTYLFNPINLKNMDFAQFVFVAHQYMVFMR